MIAGLRNRLAQAPIVRRLIRSTSWLFFGNIAVALIGLASLAFTAQAVGVVGLGVLAIVEAYTKIVDRLLRLEPWQAAMRYGIEALEAGQDTRFVRIVKMSFVTDLLGGLLSGGVALALAGLIAPMIGLPDGGNQYLWLASLSLFVTFKPTGIAVLRALDRFDTLAVTDVILAGIRVILAGAAFALGLGLWAFVAIFTIMGLLDGVLAFALAMRELRRRGYRGVWSADLRPALQENPGYLRLLWNSNLNVILRQSTQRADTLLLAVLTDQTAVGLYYAARRIAEGGLRLGRPISQAVYPEFLKLRSSGQMDKFRSLAVRMMAFLTVTVLVVAIPVMLNASWLLAVFLGDEFAQAAAVVNVQILAVGLYISGIGLNPAMISIGRDKELVRITLLAAVVYFAVFVPLVWGFGAVGASLANLMFNLVWLVCCLRVVMTYRGGGMVN